MVLNRLRSLHVALASTVFWKYSFVYFCGSVINAVLPLLLIPLFTRYLSPTDYGILGTCGILVQFLTMAIGLNSSGLIVGSQFEGSREAQRQLVSTNLFVSLALAAFLTLWAVVAGGPFQRVTRFPASWAPAVVVLALIGVIQATYLCLLQARNEAGRFVSLQVLSTGFNLTVSVVLIVAVGMRWQGRMLAMLASGALVAMISLYGLITRLKVLAPAFDQKALKSLLAFGVPLIPHALGGSVMTMAPTLYLNHLATVADTGLYSLGFRIASPIALVAGAANQAYMPALFSKLSRPESLDKLQLCRVLLLGSSALIAAGLAYGFGARLFLPLLVDPRFHEAADYVLWFALAFAIHGAYFVFTNFVVYAKRTTLIAWRADFLAGIAILVLTPWFIRLNGPIGAAQATCLAFAVSCVGSFTASRRAYSMPWAEAALSLARPLAQRPTDRSEQAPVIRTLRVREGNTGILYLTDPSGHREQYIPNYDLDQTRQLLLDFQHLRDSQGRFLADNYRARGDNWFPSMVSYLYWHVFFEYIKYRLLVDQYIDGMVEFRFDNVGNFSQLIALIAGKPAGNKLRRAIFESLVAFNNWRVLRTSPATLLFFRFTLSDFRSVEIRQALDDLKVQYIQVVPPGRILDVLRGLSGRQPYYYYGAVCAANRFHHKYDVGGLDKHTQRLFARAIGHLECTLAGYVKESARHYRRLKGTGIKTLYGFDDCNGYIFPLLYACHRAGIKTVGHQHGAYVKRHAGYVMEGIDRHDYRWFDKVIVWGEYWKDRLLQISKVYTPDMLVVGSNRLPMNYERAARKNPGRRNILIPYEFATNTHKVGMYIKKWLDLGYGIYFKARSDEPVREQLEAYCLPPERRGQIRVVERIDNDVMADVDIIAGTMSTLVYELLPYHKVVWILDTEYKHLDDLVEEGFAHKVRYEDVETLGERYFERAEVDGRYLFNPEPLRETVLKHVLGG